MFRHVFAYRLKYLMRNREMVFWTFLFPIVLSIFFTMAFSNIYQTDTFSQIPVAVVDSEAYQADAQFQSVLKSVSEGEGALLKISVTNLTQAKRMLTTRQVTGYIELKPQISLAVAGSGIRETILKSFLDSYLQTSQTAKAVLAENPAAFFSGFMKDISANQSYTKPLTGMPEPDTMLVYYYALLAMACLYGSFWGAQEMFDTQANLSPQGARANVAPVHKLTGNLAGLSACLLIQFTEMCGLLAFMRFVLNIDFGNQWGHILLLCLVGSLVGITFGAVIGSSSRMSEGVKSGVMIVSSMVMSFFSGLMFADVKYAVAKIFPLASYINPGALVADGFYALYYYQDHTRFFINIGILLLFSAVFCLIIYRVLRRQKYASL